VSGEEIHERCRYGRLTAAEVGRPSAWKPTLMPLCMWRLPEPHPPAVARSWGGAVEYERDCALCKAYDPL
jgi:hypothetical protein